MTWIHIDGSVTKTDGDGEEVTVGKGLPRRAPYMDEVLADAGKDPDDHLPIDYTENRKANVPAELAEAMVERYDHATISSDT